MAGKWGAELLSHVPHIDSAPSLKEKKVDTGDCKNYTQEECLYLLHWHIKLGMCEENYCNQNGCNDGSCF